MKTTLLAVILFASTIEAFSNEYQPLIFVVANNKGPVQFVYGGGFKIAWTFRQKTSRSYADLDMKNMEFTLVMANMFDEPIHTFVVKDTAVIITAEMLPVQDKFIMMKLEARVKNIKSGAIVKFLCLPLALRQEQKPKPQLDSLLASAPSGQNSKLIVEMFLANDFFLNSISYYYNHPEYHTPEYDLFFEKYIHCITHEEKYRITWTDLGYVLELFNTRR